MCIKKIDKCVTNIKFKTQFLPIDKDFCLKFRTHKIQILNPTLTLIYIYLHVKTISKLDFQLLIRS